MRSRFDAAGARPRGLPPAPRANPVGCLVSREHVADAGDAAVFAADHGEPLQREGRPGTISQQVLERLTIDTQLQTKERDPDAGVRRKPTVLSSEHVGGRIGVEQPLHAEPTPDTTAHLLGERGQISLGDRPGTLRHAPLGAAFDEYAAESAAEFFAAGSQGPRSRPVGRPRPLTPPRSVGLPSLRVASSPAQDLFTHLSGARFRSARDPPVAGRLVILWVGRHMHRSPGTRPP